MAKQREDICDMMIKLDREWFPQVKLEIKGIPFLCCISKDQKNSQYRVNKQIKESADSSKNLGTSLFFSAILIS